MPAFNSAFFDLIWQHDNNALIGSADCFEESIHRIGTELNWSSLVGTRRLKIGAT